MKTTLAALLAAALAASATPAAACGFFTCGGIVVGADAFPPGEAPLPPDVKAQVAARDGRGLSLAGFYNDPSVAMARREYAHPVYAAPPPVYVEPPAAAPDYVEAPAPAPDYVEAPAPEPMVEGPFRHHRGPRIIMSPFGRRWAHARDHHHVY